MTTLVSNSPETYPETQPSGFFELVLPPLFGLPPKEQEASSSSQSAQKPSFTDFLAHVRITDAHKGIIPFETWPHLLELAAQWEMGESQVVVKARQLGVSWLLAAYALWTAMYQDGATVLELSQGQAEAYELLGKSRDIYDHLDGSMRVQLDSDSAGALGFVGGGRIIALPATQRAGRSYTATLVIADEAAFHPWAQQNYVAYKPTLDGGGQLLMVSTANGASGFFHDMYWASYRAETPYRARFIPWHARPGRDAVWLERERASFQGLPGEFAQEYPATDSEAFVAHSGLVYGVDSIDGLPIFDRGRNVREMDSDEVRHIWMTAKRRIVGVDPGGRDPSVVVAVALTEREDIVVCGHLYRRGSTSVTDIAEYIARLNGMARVDLIVVDPSSAVTIAELRAMKLPAYKANNDKAARISAMRLLLREGRLIINAACRDGLAEFSSYWWDQRKDGRANSGGDAMATRTPASHHADFLDALGYVVLRILHGLPSGWQRVEVGYR